MQPLTAGIIGFVIGWLLELAIDYWFWRGSPARSADAQEIARLKAEIQALQSGNRVSARPSDTKGTLIDIVGIGPVFAKRLEAANIKSFADLASSSADHLRSIVKAEDWQKIEPERWIQEAAERVGKR